MAHWRESTCATSRFEARRRASGRLVTPERRISSWVITWIAEAAWESFSGRLETEVTSRFINCSRVSFFRAPGDAAESGCWARPCWATTSSTASAAESRTRISLLPCPGCRAQVYARQRDYYRVFLRQEGVLLRHLTARSGAT